MKGQLTSQKPAGGSPKQVLGVSWEFSIFYYQLKKIHFKTYMNSCKFIDNKWCFNNKNDFTAIK